jgi:hypothetical protein
MMNMMNELTRKGLLLLAFAVPLVMPACDGAQWEDPGGNDVLAGAPQEGEAIETEHRLLVDIELGNGNRYELWADRTSPDSEPGFVVSESGPDGNPSVTSVQGLDNQNLSELFHAIAPPDMDIPAELLAAFGEPSAGERGWLAEHWQDPANITATGPCNDTWWVNEICNKQPQTTHQTWINWGVSTTETSWHWNTYNQNSYYVAACNQGSNFILLRVRYKDKSSDPVSQYERVVSPNTYRYWWRTKSSSGIYNIHSYVFALSGTSTADMCVARTPR